MSLGLFFTYSGKMLPDVQVSYLTALLQSGPNIKIYLPSPGSFCGAIYLSFQLFEVFLSII